MLSTRRNEISLLDPVFFFFFFFTWIAHPIASDPLKTLSISPGLGLSDNLTTSTTGRCISLISSNNYRLKSQISIKFTRNLVIINQKKMFLLLSVKKKNRKKKNEIETEAGYRSRRILKACSGQFNNQNDGWRSLYKIF